MKIISTVGSAASIHMLETQATFVSSAQLKSRFYSEAFEAQKKKLKQSLTFIASQAQLCVL
jgi:hypothetical protein